MERTRTPSVSSESTFIWSPAKSTDRHVLSALKKQRLADELRTRGLPCTGRKDDLVTRLLDDNTRLQATPGSSDSTTSQDETDSDGHGEADSKAPAAIDMLRAEVDELRRLLTQQRHELPTRTGHETASQRHEGVRALAAAATQGPTDADHGIPPQSSPQNDASTAPEGTPSLNEVMAMFARAQLQMTEALTRMSAPASPVLIQSTNDTASAIPEYDGSAQRNALTWISQVERVAALAHWSPSLTLATAATRLQRAAKDWHSSYGIAYETWDTWKQAFTARFDRKLTMQEFLDLQAARALRSSETLVEYMYSKNAILDKSPYPLANEERISLILSGINEDTWANPLAAQPCSSVIELIDRAALLDTRRRKAVTAQTTQLRNSALGQRNRMRSSDESRGTADDGRGDPGEQSRRREQREPGTSVRAKACFNCGNIGHLSRDCTRPKTEATIRAERRRGARTNEALNTGPTNRQANCFLQSTGGTLPIVKGFVGNRPVRVCIDSGSNVSVLNEGSLGPDVRSRPWTSPEKIEVLDRCIRPSRVATMEVTVGTSTVRLEEVVIAPLPSAMDLILGSDWRRAANVDVTFHPSNDITLVPVQPSVSESPSHAPGAHDTNRVGETLITAFSNRKTPDEAPTSDIGFVRFNSKDPGPDEDFAYLVEEAVSKMTRDADAEERDELRAILKRHHRAFTTKTDALGLCDHAEHSIELRDDIPVASRPYRSCPADRHFMREQVNDYLAKGIIRPSQSQYCAPTIVVDQPHHPTTPRRMVHDYRKLNEKTINPPYPMPVMEDVIDDIMRDGSRYFTVLDVKSAFLTVRIKPEDIHKTAFVTPDGKYEYLRMAFGFCKAPQTMQRVMRDTFDGLKRTSTYMDDVGQGAASVPEALSLLDEALRRVVVNGLKMDIKKCQFVRDNISFLGYVISADGRTLDEARVAAVDKFEPERNAKKLYSFLQFANHYRKFIPEFSKLTYPLRQLVSKDAPFIWTSAHQEIVDKTKSALKNPPLLANFRSDCPTQVHVDASQTGLGAILTQTQDGRERVIEYASRSLNKHDGGLHSNMLECMALHWAITEKFSIYLRGGPRFTVYTDNFSLSYLVKKGATNRRFARWTLDLAEYDFDVKHRPGRQNAAADALSRQTVEAEHSDNEVTRNDLACLAVIVSKHGRIRELQECDPECQKFRAEAGTSNSSYEVEDDILLKKSIERGRVCRRVVVPAALRSSVMAVFHDDNGHLGSEKTKTLVQRKYWWPSIAKDIRRYIESCHTCQAVNSRTTRAEGCLNPREIPSEPNVVISLDHMGPLDGNEGYVLVCIDHATRYMDAVAVPSTSSKHYLDFLTNRWIPRFGVPSIIITDQARGFVNKRTAQVHHRLGIQHVNSPPYWPQSNGLIERMVGTLKQVLRKVISNSESWKKELPKATFAINVTKHRLSNESPFYLMHGYDPKVPGELNIGTIGEEIDAAQRLHEMAKGRRDMKNSLEKSQEESTKRYNERRQTPHFQCGDLVLLEIGARSTLDARYEGPFEITALTGPNMAVISRIPHIPGKLNEKTVNIEQLRRYKERALDTGELISTTCA
ncbi:hypothetical protein V5799_019450 [Amblyomma americanum]|uniref:RNA-directed DNA polymerase n=1 Tax=Amblyomma americanum TaxID=6943 RepID=A0AAQ4EWU9_AMBAM